MQQAETQIFILTQHKQNNVTVQLNIQLAPFCTWQHYWYLPNISQVVVQKCKKFRPLGKVLPGGQARINGLNISSDDK
jgi:hypothetical protein